MHTYGEIPDTTATKKFIPIMRYVYRILRHLGSEYLENLVEELSDEILYDTFKFRLNSSIEFAKAVMDGKVPDPTKSMTYAFFPPVITIRADLQQGTGKLLYGESNDISFVCLNDINEEIFFVLNLHCEDGIPVDWWIAGPQSELLDRRHIKYGFKLRDISKKSKNLSQAGFKLIDVLKDVRNERTPQWATSNYIVSMVWGTGAINTLNELSSYEAMGLIYDGISTKRILGEYLFCYIPWPPLIETLTFMPRNSFIMRLVGLTTGGLLYLTHVEREARTKIREMAPEALSLGSYETWEKHGVPNPAMTLGVKVPNLKDKRIYAEEQFEWEYPSGEPITLADLNMDVEEALDGVLTDLTHDFPIDQKFTTDHIISTGIGLTTKFWSETKD
ncbi:MAG: hypothetical protein HWN66_11175 [Candidatus Helarchaeota archaeon]|nr:hypothetical protein [Candidatus Helarchaeota archaeon]